MYGVGKRPERARKCRARVSPRGGRGNTLELLSDGLRLQPLDLFDQCGALQVQKLCGLSLVVVRSLERLADEVAFDAGYQRV